MATISNAKIDRDVQQVIKQLDKLSDLMYINVAQNKSIKKRAARSLEAAMYLLAPRGETGNLRKSIQFLPLKSKTDIFVGPKARVAPHWHLVNFGYSRKTNDGVEKIQGNYFIDRSYHKTKDTVLNELIRLTQREFEKIGKQLEVNE